MDSTGTITYNEIAGTNSWSTPGKSRRTSEPVTTTTNKLLRSLPRDLFERLRASLRSVFLSKDQMLFMQDDRMDYVYFPETAVISEMRTLDDGRTVEVALEGRESAIGLSGMLSATRSANCTQVAQAGSAVRIEREVLEKIARLNPELTTLLLPDMDNYVRQISQRAICNMYHSVKERFCGWLLMMHDRSGKKNLKLTHEQIARVLGVYRPSVTCIALELRDEGLIDYARGRISIKDSDGLARAACDCYLEVSSN